MIARGLCWTQATPALDVGRPGLEISARVRLTPAVDRPLALMADHGARSGVPVPGRLVDFVMRSHDP